MIVLSVPVVGTSGAIAIVKLSLHHDCISIGTISTADCSNQTHTTGHLLMKSIYIPIQLLTNCSQGLKLRTSAVLHWNPGRSRSRCRRT